MKRWLICLMAVIALLACLSTTAVAEGGTDDAKPPPISWNTPEWHWSWEGNEESPSAVEAGENMLFDMQKHLEAAGADELPGQLPEDARALMERTGTDTFDIGRLLSLTPEAFFGEIWALVRERIRQPMRIFGVLLGTVLLCALLESLKTAMWDSSLTSVFSAVSVVCVASAITAPIVDCITSTAAAIDECARFITAFIPVFSSVVTVGGQPATASAYTALLFMACQMVSRLVAGVFVPLMGIYLAFCIAGNLAPGVNINAAAQAIKQVVNWALGLLLTLFVSLLSLQTFVASSGDAVLGKAAKFLLGSFVPVVGSALGDAFSATQGYMRLLKTSVGAFGILAALMTFLPIFLQTVIWYLTVCAAAAVSEMLGIRQTAEILKSSSATLGLLMGVILCFALLIIVSTSMVLLATGGG